MNSQKNPHLGKWDIRFLRIAEEVKHWSKDVGTTVGCVLVRDRRILATGFNGFPQNLSDSLARYHDREFKLAAVIHAEKNAIINAARNGAQLEGSTAYVTFPPCSQCAAALVQAGVKLVVCPNPLGAPDRWLRNFYVANDILCEAGVKVLYYSEPDLHADEDMQYLRSPLGE